jgi:hypothetical protein
MIAKRRLIAIVWRSCSDSSVPASQSGRCFWKLQAAWQRADLAMGIDAGLLGANDWRRGKRRQVNGLERLGRAIGVLIGVLEFALGKIGVLEFAAIGSAQPSWASIGANGMHDFPHEPTEVLNRARKWSHELSGRLLSLVVDLQKESKDYCDRRKRPFAGIMYQNVEALRTKIDDKFSTDVRYTPLAEDAAHSPAIPAGARRIWKP